MLKESPRLTFGPVAVDFLEGINVQRMREERAAKTRQALKKAGVPAILVTGVNNVRYLVGVTWVEFQPGLGYCLFFAEGDPVVYAPAGSLQQVPDQAPWIKHWRPARALLQGIAGPEATKEEATLIAKEIRHELEERGLAKEKMGIVAFEEVVGVSLKEAGIKVVDGLPILLEASKTKTVDEVNCLKMAVSFCGTGWQKFIEVCKPGMAAGAVNRIVLNSMGEAGAEHPWGGIISGPLTFERSCTIANRRLEAGDIAYYPLCGTSYMGYTACCYRCFKVGKRPTDKEKDMYNKLKDVLDNAIEATKVGNTTADAAKAFPPASRWGQSELEVLSVQFGHGIGLVSAGPHTVAYNYPVINRQWSLKYPQPFEEGMVVAYEALEGEKHRAGGVRFEDMVVITKDGPELLDYFPRDEIIPVGIVPGY